MTTSGLVVALLLIAYTSAARIKDISGKSVAYPLQRYMQYSVLLATPKTGCAGNTASQQTF